MKRKVKRVVTTKKESKKITKLLERKNSKALQYVLKLSKQSKKDEKRHNGNALYPGKRLKAKGDITREN